MPILSYVIPTTAGTTSVTINGVAGYWRELPPQFPPIADMKYYGSTTPALPDYSVAYEMLPSSTQNYPRGPNAQRVESFIKGSRWFRLDTALIGAGGADYIGARVHVVYRAVNEMGENDVAN